MERPLARDGPRPDSGQWAVFHPGETIRCPGYNNATRHPCNKGIGRVRSARSIAVRALASEDPLSDACFTSVCARCKSMIAWRAEPSHGHATSAAGPEPPSLPAPA